MDNVESFKLFSEYQNLIRDFVENKIREVKFDTQVTCGDHLFGSHEEYKKRKYELREKVKSSKQKMDEATKKLFELIKVNDKIPLPDPFGISLHSVLP